MAEKHEEFRILMAGDNKTVLDMFFNNIKSFEVQTVSTRHEDIMCHLKYFHPDAFVYTVVNDSYNGIKKMPIAKQELKKQKVPFIFIGTAEECNRVDSMAPGVVDIYIQKPFTVEKIREKVEAIIHVHREEKEEEEREKAAAQAALEAENKKIEEEKAEAEPEEEEKNIVEDEDIGEIDIDELLKEVKAAKRKKHVLVVDDDPGMLKVIKAHLSEKYGVATAVSGKIALNFLEKKDTDLVLLDYMMPEMDGPAVLKEIRRNPKTKHLPTVFLTGVTDREKILELLSSEDRPQGYIIKPVEKDKLLASIKNLIG